MPRIKSRIDILRREDIVEILRDLSPKERSKFIAAQARISIKDAQDSNAAIQGSPPAYVTYVNGARSNYFEGVDPDHGSIVADFQLFDDLFDYVWNLLVEHSPVGKATDDRPGHPGLYRASHVLVIDRKAHTPGDAIPENWHEAAFVNTVPYARKIERGLSNQAPDGVYESVAKLAADRYGNLAKITFSYRDVLQGDISEWAATTRMESKRVQDRDIWLRRQPAVVIVPR